MGICYECSTQNMDSSQKRVSHCEICNKWFCEAHLKPKFPYFVDWDTVFDAQGDPKIKALFHTEYNREGGHPDFVYLKKTVEALNLEEKTRDKLIQQRIDEMMEADKKRILHTAEAMGKLKAAFSNEAYAQNVYYKNTPTTKTYENKYHYRFTVPAVVYVVKEYREKLNAAKTLSEVGAILRDYDKHYRKKQGQTKKKHWWQ